MSEEGGTMFSAPSSSGSQANLIITSEPYAGSLWEYKEATIKAVKTVDPSAKMIDDSFFSSDSRAHGHQVTFRRKIRDVDIEQNLYFLDGLTGKKIVMTTTAPPMGEGYTFLVCARTLAISSR